MRYTVIFSKNHWMLARLSTDMQLSGFKNSSPCGEWQNPFEVSEGISNDVWVSINDPYEDGDLFFTFHNHPCKGDPLRLWVTEKNYTKVLAEITGNL